MNLLEIGKGVLLTVSIGVNMDSKKDNNLIRSSAAEYLTFVASGGNSESTIEIRYENENIWLTQKMMAVLYDVSVPAVNQHLKRIFSDNELEENSVIKNYLTTAADGKEYNIDRILDFQDKKLLTNVIYSWF